MNRLRRIYKKKQKKGTVEIRVFGSQREENAGIAADGGRGEGHDSFA